MSCLLVFNEPKQYLINRIYLTNLITNPKYKFIISPYYKYKYKDIRNHEKYDIIYKYDTESTKFYKYIITLTHNIYEKYKLLKLGINHCDICLLIQKLLFNVENKVILNLKS